MNMNHHHISTIRRSIAVLAAGSLLVGLAACGDDSASTTEPVSSEAVTSDSMSAESTAPVTELTVSGAWARTSPMMATMGAAYMTITSPVDDRLLGAAVDPSVADHAEVHEVVMVESTDTTMAMGSETTMAMGMGADTTMAMGGEMTMREVDHIDLVAGVPLELAPGGYHVMIIDLVAPLEIGSSISITLSFETAGDIVVDVPVLDEAP
jgi:copper(I)-binding protein